MSFPNYKHPRRIVSASVMAIISAALVFVLYLQVRDRFRDPEIKTTEQAKHSTTGMAVHDAGAQLSPTEQKLSVEPETPKTFQPADHPSADAPAK
jgi:hypothetical protein